ncbi:MAG: hypothetical protein K0R99_544 [Microbacterium sp.]|jgi:hypothetical protein|uniref:hypothetical protein n=1 Tax=Microbacterium sp. TaxID=51671 RepID=UPI002628E752|nr:hypothetical protein [Microbacterium sp.]MDF2559098.1 hypothetical protein [Microbacterium sp.]
MYNAIPPASGVAAVVLLAQTGSDAVSMWAAGAVGVVSMIGGFLLLRIAAMRRAQARETR